MIVFNVNMFYGMCEESLHILHYIYPWHFMLHDATINCIMKKKVLTCWYIEITTDFYILTLYSVTLLNSNNLSVSSFGFFTYTFLLPVNFFFFLSNPYTFLLFFFFYLTALLKPSNIILRLKVKNSECCFSLVMLCLFRGKEFTNSLF